MNFKNVDKKYRPIPFWSWNEKLDVEETRRQVALMDEAGAEAAMEATVATTGTAMKAAPAAAAENDTILYSMAVEPRVEIPAEAGRFLEDFSVAEETDTELQYHLSPAELETLLDQMAQANLSPLAEEAVTPDADQVLVVLKK